MLVQNAIENVFFVVPSSECAMHVVVGGATCLKRVSDGVHAYVGSAEDKAEDEPDGEAGGEAAPHPSRHVHAHQRHAHHQPAKLIRQHA